jgi:DNA-binding transcriptional ArsR family regulator
VLSKSFRKGALNPSQVRAARANLLAKRAASLMNELRTVICEPVRTQIVGALSVGPLTVTELVATIDRSRTVVSQHLRILRRENLVQPDRRGRLIYYALTTGRTARSATTVLALVAELGV